MAPSNSPDPIAYENSVYQAGLHSAKPPFSFHPSDWEAQAKEVLSANSWGYIHGNAGAGSTYRKNLAAFDRWSVVPRRLRPSRRDPDTDEEAFPDTRATVLGSDLPFPVALAPIGVQRIFHREGEVAAARAAAALGVPYTLSTASSTSIEDVARAMDGARPGAARWFQLYWPPSSPAHDGVTASLLARARAAGYGALVVTLDTYALGWRPADMNNGYNPFLHPDRIGVEIGLTDPAFGAKFRREHGRGAEEGAGAEAEAGVARRRDGRHDSESTGGDLGEAAAEWARVAFPGHSHGWEDLALLRRHWDGPVVLKGIQSVGDARRAVEAGVQGIVVSNHGGRQQDGGASSLGLLPGIVAAVGGEVEVFFDSGVRCGADVLKAVALGARCVFVGRPYAYGLAIGGEEGVKHVLRSLCGDFLMNMHLSGLRGLDEVTRDVLVKEDDLF